VRRLRHALGSFAASWSQSLRRYDLQYRALFEFSKQVHLRVTSISGLRFGYGNVGGPITGVFTGPATPRNSLKLLLFEFVTQTFPDASIAML
jgi:hypothetical protein